MAGGIQAFQLDSLADPDDVSFAETSIDASDARRGGCVCQHGRMRCLDQPGISTCVVQMLVRIEDLGDLPAPSAGSLQTQAPFQRIDGKGLP